MSLMAKFIPLVLICLIVFTEPGRNIYSAAVDWGSDKVAQWGADRAEESLGRQDLSQRLRGLQPACNSDFTPQGFQVSEGEAIALVVGRRKVDCERVTTEPMGGGPSDARWSVHVETRKPDRCEFSADVDGTTGELSNRYNSCKR